MLVQESPFHDKSVWEGQRDIGSNGRKVPTEQYDRRIRNGFGVGTVEVR